MRSNRSLRRPSTPKIRPHCVAWALIVALLGAGAAQASPECPNAGNLFSNCGFETDTSGWDFSSGDTFLQSNAEAHTGTFSLAIDALVLKHGGFASIEICLENVSANTPYEYGGWFQTGGAGGAVAGCQISAATFSQKGCCCFAESESNESIDPPNGTFQPLREAIVTTAETVSIGVGFGCTNFSTSDDFLAYVDDLFLIFDDTVFADGFEARSGDTCEWDFASGGC